MSTILQMFTSATNVNFYILLIMLEKQVFSPNKFFSSTVQFVEHKVVWIDNTTVLSIRTTWCSTNWTLCVCGFIMEIPMLFACFTQKLFGVNLNLYVCGIRCVHIGPAAMQLLSFHNSNLWRRTKPFLSVVQGTTPRRCKPAPEYLIRLTWNVNSHSIRAG